MNLKKIISIITFLFIFAWLWGGNIKTTSAQTLEDLAAQIAALQQQITQLQNEVAKLLGESEYKCPDLNEDGKVDLYDAVIINAKLNTCQGDANYDSRGDVDGDGCLTEADANFVKKYYGKKAEEIYPQCVTTPPPPSPPKPEDEYKCPDFNRDGTVDVYDVVVISTRLGSCQGDANYNSQGDVDRDGCLTDTDLNFVKKHYGVNSRELVQCKGVAIPPRPPLPESEYKCPDLNGDGKVDLYDTVIINTNLNTCQGDANYDASLDINGDGCLTEKDANFVKKHYGKQANEISPQCVIKPPPKPEEEYKCPDLNGDGKVDLYDTVIINTNLNTCQGDANYDSRGDVDRDGCLTTTDLNFVNKYYGKKAEEIYPQCVAKPPPPPPPTYHSLILDVSGQGTTNPSVGTYTYEKGTKVTITAIPDSGWNFDHWLGNISGNKNPTVVTIDSDKAIIAYFKKILPDQYSLTIKVTGKGTTSPSAGTYTYEEGTKVTIKAIPASEWEFSYWVGTDNDSINPTTVTMNSNKNVTSVFQEIPLGEDEYKCPDFNRDGTVDIYDVVVISTRIGSCQGDANYNSQGDVDRDGCLTDTDLNFAKKHYGVNSRGLIQCKGIAIPPRPPKPVDECLCPDLNEDGKVDLYDTVMVAGLVNTCEGDAKYDSTIDVNGDGCITEKDSNFVAKYYGQLRNDISPQCVIKPPPLPESEYKCPDLNGDGKVDLYDAVIINTKLNTCQGDANYDSTVDVDKDNCITQIDVNFVSKYYGMKASEIEQCKGETTLEYIERMVASINDLISQLTKGLKELLR